MNLEIANRLVELRKKHGFSQEALADKLGVSRQAVSKWERVEAAPDTDNLIALARLYGVSLDELLGFADSSARISEEEENAAPQAEESAEQDTSDTDDEDDEYDDGEYDDGEYDVNSGRFYDKEKGGGIHIKDGKDSIHIGPGGIHIKDDKDDVHINWRGIHINSAEDAPDRVHIDKHGAAHFEWNNGGIDLGGIAFLIAIASYLLLGFIGGYWHPGWLVFFAAPILPALIKPKQWEGCFPVFVTGMYLLMGFVWNLWHPGWVIFFSIPVFYTIWNGIKHRKRIV